VHQASSEGDKLQRHWQETQRQHSPEQTVLGEAFMDQLELRLKTERSYGRLDDRLKQ